MILKNIADFYLSNENLTYYCHILTKSTQNKRSKITIITQTDYFL
ncbi:hypothetical protein PPBDW_I20822 [Photobacterium kishitanii]|nr:hypothetical protein PPBDW_I20822 [Photobacterium kishitanii]